MKEADSTEKQRLSSGPFLPPSGPSMTYRDLRRAAETGPIELFDTARRYAASLLERGQPARAILALCRAFYIDPSRLGLSHRQPFEAYRWILENASGSGFMGNPRVSFHHQAVRIRKEFPLKRMRAWALWHLTRVALPDLPPDPLLPENAPTAESVAGYLDEHGLPGEGRHFLQVLGPRSGTGPRG